MGSPFGSRRGARPNPSSNALQSLRGLDARTKEVYTWDYAVVTRYDHVSGLVDVRIKLDSGGMDIKNVPVWGRGGSRFRFGWSMVAAQFDPADPRRIVNKPDVGMLLYPRLDSTRALEDFQLRPRPFTSQTHRATQGIFMPGVLVAGQETLANTHIDPDYLLDNNVFTEVLEHEVGHRDSFFLNPQGFGIIIKESGRVVIRTKDYCDVLKEGQVEADVEQVVITGDNGDGAITSPLSGSGVLRSGGV